MRDGARIWPIRIWLHIVADREMIMRTLAAFLPALVIAVSGAPAREVTQQGDILVTAPRDWLTADQCAAIGRGEDPASVSVSDTDRRIAPDACAKLNRVEQSCVERVWLPSRSMAQTISQYRGSRAGAEWRVKKLIACLEKGAREHDLAVSFTDSKVYGDDYERRVAYITQINFPWPERARPK